jgi:hypothetical protein
MTHESETIAPRPSTPPAAAPAGMDMDMGTNVPAANKANATRQRTLRAMVRGPTSE